MVSQSLIQADYYRKATHEILGDWHKIGFHMKNTATYKFLEIFPITYANYVVFTYKIPIAFIVIIF